jgi:hypothetical protein
MMPRFLKNVRGGGEEEYDMETEKSENYEKM